MIREHEDEGDMGPVVVTDKTSISIPVIATVGAVIIGGILWLSKIDVAIGMLQSGASNTDYRIQRMEQSLERVEIKLDRMRDQEKAR